MAGLQRNRIISSDLLQKGVAATPCLEYLPASAEDALGLRTRRPQMAPL